MKENDEIMMRILNFIEFETGEFNYTGCICVYINLSIMIIMLLVLAFWNVSQSG